MKVTYRNYVDNYFEKYELDVLGHLPLDSHLTTLSDRGMIEEFESEWLEEFAQKVKNI